jgi:prevent-host-death family protein
MREYTASEARERFAELLHTVEQGEDVAITRHGKAIAKITRVKDERIPAPGWGVKEGWSITTTGDFDSIPEEFQDYT